MSRAMKPNFPALASAAWFLPLLLSACSGGSDDGPGVDDTPAVSVSELAAGSYSVSAGDVANPTAGKYYAAADGNRLLVLNDGAQQATAMYRRDGNGKWQMTPAPKENTTLELLNSSPMSSHVVSITAVAGVYSVRLAAGVVASFAVNAGGDIVPGNTGCKFSGKLTSTTLPDALKLSLATAGCGDLPAQSEGFLVVDEDYSPAAFRLVTPGSTAPVDLWAYPD
jgi:hypothetical protein